MHKEIVKNIPIALPQDRQGKPLAPLSFATKANGFVFVGGMPPIDPKTGAVIGGDVESQTRLVLDNIKLILEAAGSSLDRVVKVTVFCTKSEYFSRVNAIYQQYFPVDPPARSFINGVSWPGGYQFDIEIECIAVAGD
jgi:2-iminobutanoate/2-iminopropanoate deaminase